MREIQTYLYKLLEIGPEGWSIVFFSSGVVLTIFYIVRKAAREQLDKINKIKKAKELLVGQLSSTLSTLEALNDAMIRQKDLLDSFEDETIVRALDEVNSIRSKYGIFNYLNDADLVNKIIFYFDGKSKLLQEMLDIERESYEFQLEYQQKLVGYNRELEVLKETIVDELELLAKKRALLMELEKSRAQVTLALQTLREKRIEYYNEIKVSKDFIGNLKQSLQKYSDRNISSKRFYPRYLAFA